MLKAAIFDMDGVLIDAVPSAQRVKAKVLREEYDVDMASIPDPHNEQHKGSSIATLLAAIREHTGVDIPTAKFTADVVHGITNDLKASGVMADAGLVALLQELKSKGLALAIGTTATKQSADNKLDILGIRHFFDAILTAEDVRHHKPNPEVYIRALQRLGVSANEAVIFEDALSGVQAGIAAHVPVIGFVQYTSDKALLPGTIKTIQSWQEISYDQLAAHVQQG